MNHIDGIEWNDEYPDKRAIRQEILTFAEAAVEALLNRFQAHEIRGIYLAGSAMREWQTIIDYVPEISDVDICIRFRKDEHADRLTRRFDVALDFQQELERGFTAKTPQPRHMPRPQVSILNNLEKQKGYIPFPLQMVSLLYGEEYTEPGPYDEEAVKRRDRESLLEEEAFLDSYPGEIYDKYDKYNVLSLRALAWRVSPAGPRILDLLGKPVIETWSMNRTAVVRELRAAGQSDLANSYAFFYKESWAYFLSDYHNGTAARNALSAAAEVLRGGSKIAREWVPA